MQDQIPVYTFFSTDFCLNSEMLTSILALQADVAREIAKEVKGRLSSQDEARLRDRRSVDPAAP